jgi:hypothetical protein
LQYDWTTIAQPLNNNCKAIAALLCQAVVMSAAVLLYLLCCAVLLYLLCCADLPSCRYVCCCTALPAVLRCTALPAVLLYVALICSALLCSGALLNPQPVVLLLCVFQ